jgi:hypothetical protein
MSMLTLDVGCASIRLHLIACESVMLLVIQFGTGIVLLGQLFAQRKKRRIADCARTPT